MYQVIEFNDYRKENYIHLHGVTSDLEKAKQRAQEILQGYVDPKKNSREDCFVEIYRLPKDHCNEYVYVKDRMYQYSYRTFEFPNLLNKTIQELYEIIDEKVPKDLSPDQIITKDVLKDLIYRKVLTKHLDFLIEDIGDICMDTCSTIVAIVKCEEF